jgi:hypothetical protein
MALVPTVVNDGLLGGGDFRVGKSLQTDKGAINASPVFTPVRRRSGKTDKAIGYVQDETVSDTYQGQEQIQDTKDLTISIEASFVKQSVDLLIEAMYASETLFTDTDTVFAALADGYTVSPDAYAALSVGDAFWIDGFSVDAANGFAIVAEKAASNKIVTAVAPGATDAAGDSVTLTMSKYVNANNAYYSTFQTRATDLSKASDINYHTIYDAIPNNFSMEIGETGIVSATADYVAEREVEGEDSISGQTYAAAQTDRPISAVQNIVDFYVNDEIATCKMKSLTVSIALNQQGDDAAACTKYFTRGAFAVTGSSVVRSMKSNPFVWRNYYWNGTRVSIAVLIDHGGGDQTFIVLPQVVLTEAPMDDGNNAIANTQASFTAEGNATTNSTIRVYRNW